MSVCFCAHVCVYVTISGCQLQFCGPEENSAASLRVLLVPLSYRCAGLRLCQFLCVCLRVRVCMHTILLQETKVIPQGFLLGWDLDTWIYQLLSNICSNCCLMLLWEKISKTIFSSCFSSLICHIKPHVWMQLWCSSIVIALRHSEKPWLTTCVCEHVMLGNCNPFVILKFANCNCSLTFLY